MVKYFSLLLLALGLLALPLYAADAPAAAGSEHEKMNADQQFAHEACIGNLAEVQLGQLAEKQAANDQLKTFGQRMVKDHSAANKDLQQAVQGKNITLPTDLDQHHKDLYDSLAKLQGDEFDKAYIDHMVKDHTKDVATYENSMKTLTDADLRSYASRTLPIIQEHLKLAKDIQKSLTGQASEH